MITAGLYDLFVLFLVCLFAWRGYQKGLVSQLGALLVLIVVTAISVRYTPSLADFLGNGNGSNAIAFIITILIVTLIVWNIVNALSKLVTKMKLKSWNNQMGAFLGVINGIFISMLMTFLLLIFVLPHPTTNADGTYNQVTYDSDKSFIKNSFFGPYLTSATLTAIDHLPQGGNSRFYTNLRDLLQSKAENIKEQHPDLQEQQTYESESPANYDNRPYASGYSPSSQPGYSEPQSKTYSPTRMPGYSPSSPSGYNPSSPSGYSPSTPSGYNPPSPSGYSQPGPSGYSEPQSPTYNPSTRPGYGGSTAPANPNPGYNGSSPLDGVL